MDLPPTYSAAIAIGSTRYFTGTPCVHGHIAPRRTKNSHCCKCKSITSKRCPSAKVYRQSANGRASARRRASTPAARAWYRVWRKEWRRRSTSAVLAARLASNLRGRVRGLKGKSALVGCSATELHTHLESLFQPGMSWENYGFGADRWHIDHKIPLASFNLAIPEQQALACHYTNLQPLWQKDNLAKGAQTNWALTLS